MAKDKGLEALSEEAREIRKMTMAIQAETSEISKLADAAMKRADAAWELVVITRNQVQEEMAYMRKPFWKRWFGIS